MPFLCDVFSTWLTFAACQQWSLFITMIICINVLVINGIYCWHSRLAQILHQSKQRVWTMSFYPWCDNKCLSQFHDVRNCVFSFFSRFIDKRKFLFQYALHVKYENHKFRRSLVLMKPLPDVSIFIRVQSQWALTWILFLFQRQI